MPTQFRVVLDTNILLRGLINKHSASGRVVDACDRRDVVLLLSRSVLWEYQAVLTDATIVERYPELSTGKVEIALRRLRYVGDVFVTAPTKFDFPRDPKDAKFIELAIAGNATHIVSGDGDLISLASGHGDAAKRFRQRAAQVKILDAAMFLDVLNMEFNL